MVHDSTTLPVAAAALPHASPIAVVADIPEEEIWLSKQRSARTRRAYRLDVKCFMRTLSIASPEEFRRADHRAVIAWERYMRKVKSAASSTIRRRLAALSSVYKHLVRHGHAPRNPIGKVERPAINRDEGATAAFSKAQARKLLDLPGEHTVARLRDRAILSVGLQVRLRRAEIAAPKVGDLHQNRGYDSLGVIRKGGRRDASTIDPQTIQPGCAPISRAPATALMSTGRCSGRSNTMANGARNAEAWTPTHRSRGPEICGGARARSRLLAAFDARDLHHHDARERGSA